MSKVVYKLEQANEGSCQESGFSIISNNRYTPTEYKEEHSVFCQIVIIKGQVPQPVPWFMCVLQPGLLCLMYPYVSQTNTHLAKQTLNVS